MPTSSNVYMQRAIALARENPRRPFGALLVRSTDGLVVSEGVNRSGESPIWHAEIVAIHKAANSNLEFEWNELQLFSTAEPCPMCLAAMVWAGIPVVQFGTSVTTLRRLGWNQFTCSSEHLAASAFRPVELVGGILEKECDELFEAAILRE